MKVWGMKRWILKCVMSIQNRSMHVSPVWSHWTATFELLIFYVAKSFVGLMAMKSNYYVMGCFVYVIKNNAPWCSGGHLFLWMRNFQREHCVFIFRAHGILGEGFKTCTNFRLLFAFLNQRQVKKKMLKSGSKIYWNYRLKYRFHENMHRWI